jgi:hypothetical protein
MTRLCNAALCAVALLFSSASVAQSCSEAAPPPPVVKPAFKLTVLDHSQAPELGVRVTLGTVDRYNVIHPVSNGTTDKDGVLNFISIKPGIYSFRFTDASGERQWQALQVAPDGQDAVAYTWHYTKWVALSVASGVLMHDDEPMRHYHVTLEGYPDGYSLGTSDTDLDGRFDLPASRPGKYYFDIAETDTNGEAHSIGRIPVNIAAGDGSASSEEIFVDQNTCGVAYDQFCTLPAVKLDTSCVQAVSPTGVAIGKARASLRSQNGSAAPTRLRANDAGVIQFPNLAAGDYQLQVFAAGYTPIRRTLTVSAGAGACTTISVLTMNPFGQGCAPVPGKVN